MAIQFVSTSGRLTFLATAGGASLFGGLCQNNVSYRASTNLSTAQCAEDAEEQKFVSLITHEVSGTFNYQVADTDSVFNVGTDAFAVYLSQNGTTLFAGSVIVTSVEDSQGNRGSAETVSISATNNGSPSVGFAV